MLSKRRAPPMWHSPNAAKHGMALTPILLAWVVLAVGCGYGSEDRASNPIVVDEEVSVFSDSPEVEETQTETRSNVPSSGSQTTAPIPLTVYSDRVVMGSMFSCVIRFSSELVCFGFRQSRLDVPPANFVSIKRFTLRGVCGITTNKNVLCWTWTKDGHLTVHEDPTQLDSFDELFGHLEHTCAIKSAGGVACWAGGGSQPLYWSGERASNFYEITADVVTVGGRCGIQNDGSVVCWESSGIGARDISDVAPSGAFKQVVSTKAKACGLRPDGRVECWGVNECDELYPPIDLFLSLSMTSCVACGIKIDRSVACWGGWAYGEQSDIVTNSPGGAFELIKPVHGAWCGIRSDGDLVCWYDPQYLVTIPGKFESFGADTDLNRCGVRTDGSIHCWGSAVNNGDRYKKVSPPV